MVTQYGWRGAVERYTPSDAFTRFLIAIPPAVFGVYTLTWTVATFLTSGLWFPIALLLGAISLGTIFLSILLIWSVYFSIIGDGESTRTRTHTDTMSSVEEDPDDPLVIVKRQYAAGQISEEEFEQRVGNILNVDAYSESRVTNHRVREDIRETD